MVSVTIGSRLRGGLRFWRRRSLVPATGAASATNSVRGSARVRCDSWSLVSLPALLSAFGLTGRARARAGARQRGLPHRRGFEFGQGLPAVPARASARAAPAGPGRSRTALPTRSASGTRWPPSSGGRCPRSSRPGIRRRSVIERFHVGGVVRVVRPDHARERSRPARSAGAAGSGSRSSKASGTASSLGALRFRDPTHRGAPPEDRRTAAVGATRTSTASSNGSVSNRLRPLPLRPLRRWAGRKPGVRARGRRHLGLAPEACTRSNWSRASSLLRSTESSVVQPAF